MKRDTISGEFYMMFATESERNLSVNLAFTLLRWKCVWSHSHPGNYLKCKTVGMGIL